MTIMLEKEIGWDGELLSVWAIRADLRVLCEIPRDTIHAIRYYSDALSREIARDRTDIISRLRPSLLKKLQAADEHVVRLQPSDVLG